MDESKFGKVPDMRHVIHVMELINDHAAANGYDPTAALFKIVERYNSLWERKDGPRRQGLGAIGFYPQGRPLSKDDTGAVMALVDKRSDGNIYVDLGQMCIDWIALTPDLARNLAESLNEAAAAPTPKPAPEGHPNLPGLP